MTQSIEEAWGDLRAELQDTSTSGYLDESLVVGLARALALAVYEDAYEIDRGDIQLPREWGTLRRRIEELGR